MSDYRFSSQHPVADLPQLMALLGAKKKPTNGLTPPGGWYSIRNVSESEAEILIYDEIGDYGVSASEFIRDLRGLRASKIALRINSPGGNVFDGLAIYNAIRSHKASITAYVDGIAASAASYIAIGAHEVVMMPHSQMFIHDASGLVVGRAADMRKMAADLDRFSDEIASIYSEKSGTATATWRERMKDETWMSDREAVDLGLADRIEGDEPKAVKNEAPKSIDFAALINKQIEEAEAVFA